MRAADSSAAAHEAEQGFMLVGLIVAIFLILLVLGIAAPRVAKELRRERELEAVHRGDQYVRAIQLYFRKNGHYPGSIEQLEKSNNIRYLRQRYVDPMTGKPDWKLIHVGEAKTTVKGFFGKPLSGMSGGGSLGSAGGMASGTGVGAGAAGNSGSSFGTSSFGSPSSGSSPSGSPQSGTSGSSPSSGSSFGSSSFGSPGTPGSVGAGSSTGSNGISSQSATSFTGTGAPIMGVGTVATGNSIVVLNEQTSYPKWEFIYDPRIEQLKAKASLLGGGPSSTNASSFGSSATSPGMGKSGSSAFGSSSFGSSSFGSSGSNSSGSSSSGSGTTPAPSQNPSSNPPQ